MADPTPDRLTADIVLIITACVFAPAVWMVLMILYNALTGISPLPELAYVPFMVQVAYTLGIVPAIVMALVYAWIRRRVSPRAGHALALLVGGAGTLLSWLVVVGFFRLSPGWPLLVGAIPSGAVAGLVSALVASRLALPEQP